MILSRKFWQASALLAGTTIGSGILGVPYAIAQSGFLVGMVYLLGLGGAMLFLNLLFAHIVIHTNEVHQIPGYVSIYLGKYWRWLVIITLLGLGYGALTAYTLGSGNTLAELSDTPQWIMQWSFLLLGSAIVGVGVKAVSKLEVLLIIGITLLILSVAFIAFQSPSFDTKTLFTSGSSSALFLPYGVVFFAYLGFSSIPELRMILASHTQHIKKAVLLGTCIPMVLYSVFVASVIGLTGDKTTEVATIGLGNALGPFVYFGSNIFAILAMLTSFLALALVVKNMFEFDLNFGRWTSFGLTFLPPALLLLLGAQNFIGILGVTGAVSGGVMAILIVLMYIRLQLTTQSSPNYPVITGGLLLIGMLLVGMVVEIG